MCLNQGYEANPLKARLPRQKVKSLPGVVVSAQAELGNATDFRRADGGKEVTTGDLTVKETTDYPLIKS